MKSRFIVVGLCLGFFVLFFYKILFLNHVFFCCDNLLINYPARDFLQQSIQKGVFPLWYPYIFSGTPFLADINLSPLYPGQVFYVVFSQFFSIFSIGSFDILLHIIIAFFGMYVCARAQQISKNSALFTGAIYAFSGSMITYINNLPMLQVAAVFPWVFAAILYFCKKPSNTRMIYVSLLSTVLIFAGHPQLTMYAMLFSTMYLLFFLEVTFVKRIVWIVSILGLTFLLSSIQVVPFLEFSLQSTRSFFTSHYANFGSLSFIQLTRFTLPSVVGKIAQGTDIWQGGSVVGYVGFIPLLFLFLGLKSNKRNQFFIISSIVSLLIALGDNTFFYPLVRAVLPAASMFRVPTNVLFIFVLTTAFVSGLTLDHLIKEKKKLHEYFRAGWLVSIVGFFMFSFSSFIAQFFLNNLGYFPGKIETKFSLVSVNGLMPYIEGIAINIVIIGVSMGLLHFFSRRGVKYFGIVVCVLFCVDIYVVNQGAMTTVPLSQIQEYPWLTAGGEAPYA